MTRSPNILFLVPDQMRFDLIAMHGVSALQLPNIKSLFDDSVVFEKAWCAQSLCTPARGSLVTGLYPHQHGATANGIPLPDDSKALPELLGAEDYTTGYIGKWHLGNEQSAQHGFEFWLSTEPYQQREHDSPGSERVISSYCKYLTSIGYKPDMGRAFSREYQAQLPLEHTKPAFQTRSCIDFIRRNESKPWLCFLSTLEPHPPFVGVSTSWYSPEDVVLPENFAVAPSDSTPQYIRAKYKQLQKYGFKGFDLRSERGWRSLIAAYWGLNSLVDAALGNVIRYLKEAGQYDNTIIVFTADHGAMMSSHGLAAKDVQYEEAARVPLAIKPVGNGHRQIFSKKVSHVDVLPTILGMLGAPSYVNLPGRDLSKFLSTDKDCVEAPIVIERNSTLPNPLGLPVRTLIDEDDWKLNASGYGELELYNLNEDPLELRDRSSDLDCRGRALEMFGKLREWQIAQNDPVAISI